MNCSQLLEPRAKTNWERSTPSIRDMGEKFSELRSALRPWGQSGPSSVGSADPILAQKPLSPVRSR
jgi:hypothetical protein